MPWEPLHQRPWTRMLVELGLKETQSRNFVWLADGWGLINERGCACDEALHGKRGGMRGVGATPTIAVVDHRVLDGHVGGAVRIPTIGVLSQVLAARVARDVKVVEHDIRGVGSKDVVLGGVPENQVREDGVAQTVNANPAGVGVAHQYPVFNLDTVGHSQLQGWCEGES